MRSENRTEQNQLSSSEKKVCRVKVELWWFSNTSLYINTEIFQTFMIYANDHCVAMVTYHCVISVTCTQEVLLLPLPAAPVPVVPWDWARSWAVWVTYSGRLGGNSALWWQGEESRVVGPAWQLGQPRMGWYRMGRGRTGIWVVNNCPVETVGAADHHRLSLPRPSQMGRSLNVPACCWCIRPAEGERALAAVSRTAAAGWRAGWVTLWDAGLYCNAQLLGTSLQNWTIHLTHREMYSTKG